MKRHRSEPGPLAELASYGKGLSFGGTLLATCMAFAGSSALWSILRAWWTGTDLCYPNGGPCDPVGAGDPASSLVFCFVLVAFPLTLVVGKLFLPLTDEMIRDGKCFVSVGDSLGQVHPHYSLRYLVTFFNVIAWFLFWGCALVVAIVPLAALGVFGSGT